MIGVAFASWYVKRGWPRTDVPRWHSWVRAGIGIVVGLYVFGQVAVIAANNQPSTPPKQTSTPINTWNSKYLLPEVTLIAGDIRALNKGEAGHSWVGINNACFSGVADANVSVGKPPAPNARIRAQYHTWLIDAFRMFTYCQDASSTQARWLSAAGTADWAKAMTLVPVSNAAYLKLVKLVGNLKTR